MRYLLLSTLLLLPLRATAQETDPPEPSFFMMNQHKCLPGEMGQVRELAETAMQPVLEELSNEGLILGWGVLEHAWGDEWNWNFYILAESHTAFLEAWSEFGSRMEERRPNFYEGELGQWCTEHRDNIYRITAMGGHRP